MGVIVSIADFLFSNDVINSMTTYSPSGAPGKDVVYTGRREEADAIGSLQHEML